MILYFILTWHTLHSGFMRVIVHPIQKLQIFILRAAEGRGYCVEFREVFNRSWRTSVYTIPSSRGGPWGDICGYWDPLGSAPSSSHACSIRGPAGTTATTRGTFQTTRYFRWDRVIYKQRPYSVVIRIYSCRNVYRKGSTFLNWVLSIEIYRLGIYDASRCYTITIYWFVFRSTRLTGAENTLMMTFVVNLTWVGDVWTIAMSMGIFVHFYSRLTSNSVCFCISEILYCLTPL